MFQVADVQPIKAKDKIVNSHSFLGNLVKTGRLLPFGATKIPNPELIWQRGRIIARRIKCLKVLPKMNSSDDFWFMVNLIFPVPTSRF